MKAVILAAGEGTRLKPLTNVRPKPMLPVANRPLLEHVVEAVAAAGIDEIVLVVGYKRERIQNHFGDGDKWDVQITYAVQDKQLGTGDAILTAESYIGGDFVVLNGDQIVDASFVSRVIEERDRTGDVVLGVTRVDEPELYGVVEVEDNQVVDITEKPPEHAIASEFVNAGVYAFGPDVFAAIRRSKPNAELAVTATLETILSEHTIRAVPNYGPWLDVTRPWDMLTVNSIVTDRNGDTRADAARIAETASVADAVILGKGTVIQPGAVVLRGTTLGENVTIGPNTVVENSILLPDAVVGPGAVVRDCIVGANAVVGPNTTIEGGTGDVALGDVIHRDVRLGGVLGDNAELGGAVMVAPGTILGNGTMVERASVLSGWIDPEATVRR